MDFRRDIENVGNSQYEIIGGGSNIHRLDDPILKGIPKSRDRVPKKYIPATDKLAKLFFRGHAKYVANSEEGGVDKKNRGRRSVKEPRFTRREMLDDDGEVNLLVSSLPFRSSLDRIDFSPPPPDSFPKDSISFLDR